MLKEEKETKAFISIKKITIIAMLIAIGVAIGLVCKTFLDFGGVFRVTFENLTILIAGIYFGPLVGGIVGFSIDLISAVITSQNILPLITVGAVMVGVTSGLVSKYLIKERCNLQIIVSSILAHLVGSLIIKMIALYSIYEEAVIFRIPVYLIIAPIEIAIIIMLSKNTSFIRIIEEKSNI